MNLFYFKSRHGNFGDDLNPWLWPRVLGEVDSLRTADWLVGIGTIFDCRLDDLAGSKLVLGSGFNPEANRVARPEEINISFVRGPMSANMLGLDDSKFITDSAILVASVLEVPARRSGKPLFIPHYNTAEKFDCALAATIANVDYLDPRSPVSAALDAINQAPLVIAEAMHGVIIADALRVPWLRIRGYNHIRQSRMADFKWKDWGMSMSVDTAPVADARLLRYSGRGSSLLRSISRAWSAKGIAKAISSALAESTGRLSNDRNHQIALEQVLDHCRAAIRDE